MWHGRELSCRGCAARQRAVFEGFAKPGQRAVDEAPDLRYEQSPVWRDHVHRQGHVFVVGEDDLQRSVGHRIGEVVAEHAHDATPCTANATAARMLFMTKRAANSVREIVAPSGAKLHESKPKRVTAMIWCAARSSGCAMRLCRAR